MQGFERSFPHGLICSVSIKCLYGKKTPSQHNRSQNSLDFLMGCGIFKISFTSEIATAVFPLGFCDRGVLPSNDVLLLHFCRSYFFISLVLQSYFWLLICRCKQNEFILNCFYKQAIYQIVVLFCENN